MRGANLIGADLFEADVRDCKTDGVDFSGAKLPGRFAEALATTA